MKAVRYHAYGDSEVLVHEEAARPTARAGQVVIQVAAGAFSPLDVAIRMGLMREVFPVEFPHTPNYDVSGVVAEVGEGVSGWSVGDRVIAFLPPNAPGAAAEYVAAPAELLAAAPHGVDLVDAAALPSVALTARQSLFDHANLQAGQSVLVNGGGGAVGRYAVQLAARAGAAVTATASAGSAEKVRSYGAEAIVDYTATPVREALSGRRFDVVLNLVRTDPDETARLAELVADGGVFLSTTTPGPDEAGRGVRTVRVFVRGDAAQLADLVSLVDGGELRIDVAERRPLSELADVHDAAVTGRLAGKTVLIP